MNQIFEEWVRKAEIDWKVISHEMKLDKEERAGEAVLYHCQQAVEKLLKAWLCFKGVEISKTHNLEMLLALCIKTNPDFENWDFQDLTLFGVDIRYPGFHYKPTDEEIIRYYTLTDNFRSFMKELLP